jgi:branched-chain amino acid transport system ATP-binding protein
MSAVLETRGLSVSYGGVHALKEADLTVGAGELVGLIGPNGAGKTTFIDAVGGFTSSTGSVLIGDEDVSALAPHERARRGLARTWQAADLFDDLTVRENLTVAADRPTVRRTAREMLTGRADPLDAVDRTLALLELDDLADRNADELTQGQRKLVGVARALVAEPRVLCLDEPAAGLDTTESQELGRRLRAVVDQGTALLLVDHDMGLVLSVCDRVVVLNFGAVIAQGAPSDVRSDTQVVEAYLGRAAQEVTG